MIRSRIRPLFIMLLALGFLAQAGIGTKDAVPAGPHFNESRCGDCHGKARPEAAAPYGSLANLYNHLCGECHVDGLPLTCRFHAGKGTHGSGGLSLPQSFPLSDGAMNCLTCHDPKLQCVSAPQENPLFLRGNASGDALVFCYRCHLAEPFLRDEDLGQ